MLYYCNLILKEFYFIFNIIFFNYYILKTNYFISQYEENGKKGIVKEIHVDLTCQVSLDTTGSEKEVEPHTMRVSGTAIIAKAPGQSSARLLRVENIGLDSQLNILFATQWDQLVFIPL